jgi:SAM-dependent methyltransferase
VIHPAAGAGFAREAEIYARSRPSYHPALVEHVVASYGSGTIVDLGAGTGIFTGQLIAAGCSPIAVEPVAAMRAELADRFPAAEVRSGTAEHTGLEPASVDAVMAATSFHWFDQPTAMAEIVRILRPGGHLVCVWNVRDESIEWMRRWTEITDRYAGDTPRHRTMRWRRAIDADPRFELVEEWAIANPVPTTPDGVVGRTRSTSFIAALDPDTKNGVLAAVRALVEPLGPTFDLPYRSEFQAWRRQADTQTAPLV